jgi:type VI protein secretion system component VasF
MAKGLSHARALAEATTISQSQGGSGNVGRIPHFLKLDFAYATRTVFYVMAGIMAVAAVVGFLGLERGIQEETGDTRAGVAV